ncbi:OTU domain-containing protein [Wolbachia endosymbiont of Folsomia candida]|uniref:hypothetical protein n=1 Tax=Wolbachia endosymbiont of Folsomia candida TaxID=169402 RepID=UPI000B299F2B|nr:hypothetical protein [Wolbachia endosymbiont of Folsomia candida]APR99049.1 hypothetical protein ASM33_07660 [Wolbachia endosymbiont of Folsomia candida]
MLKTQYPTDYLKKEGINSGANYLSEEEQHIEQIAKDLKQKPNLKRFKRSADNLALPGNFEIKSAIGGGDCFFDSIAQGLKQLKPEMDFTVKSLREVCKRLAIDNQQLRGKVIRDARSIQDPTVIVPNSDISDDELWNIYLASIEYTFEDIEQIRINNPTLYQSLTNLKYGNTLQVPIWGRPDIEGQLICKEYSIELHIVEKLPIVGWSNQVVDGSGSRSVDDIDYNEVDTIRIINRGTNHFEPILNKERIRNAIQQQLQQSSSDNRQPRSDRQSEPGTFDQVNNPVQHPNLDNQPIDSINNRADSSQHQLPAKVSNVRQGLSSDEFVQSKVDSGEHKQQPYSNRQPRSDRQQELGISGQINDPIKQSSSNRNSRSDQQPELKLRSPNQVEGTSGSQLSAQEVKYNKREGTSGIGGQLYEINLSGYRFDFSSG